MIYGLNELRTLVLERISGIEAEIKENKGLDPNSYGQGYDCGFRDALKEILDEIPDPAKHE